MQSAWNAIRFWGNRRGFVLLAGLLELLVEYEERTWAAAVLSFIKGRQAQGQNSSLKNTFSFSPREAKSGLR